MTGLTRIFAALMTAAFLAGCDDASQSSNSESGTKAVEDAGQAVKTVTGGAIKDDTAASGDATLTTGSINATSPTANEVNRSSKGEIEAAQ